MKFPMAADIWMPLVEMPDARRRDARRFEAFGRLQDGASLETVRSEMEVLGRRLEVQYPDTNQGVRPVITPYTHRAVGGQIGSS